MSPCNLKNGSERMNQGNQIGKAQWNKKPAYTNKVKKKNKARKKIWQTSSALILTKWVTILVLGPRLRRSLTMLTNNSRVASFILLFEPNQGEINEKGDDIFRVYFQNGSLFSLQLAIVDSRFPINSSSTLIDFYQFLDTFLSLASNWTFPLLDTSKILCFCTPNSPLNHGF